MSKEKKDRIREKTPPLIDADPFVLIGTDLWDAQ
jgi:hypothetical protein